MSKENVERNLVDLYLSLNEILEMNGKPKLLEASETVEEKPALSFRNSVFDAMEEATPKTGSGFARLAEPDMNQTYVDVLNKLALNPDKPTIFTGKIEISLDESGENVVIYSSATGKSHIYDNSVDNAGDKTLVSIIQEANLEAENIDIYIADLEPKKDFKDRTGGGNVDMFHKKNIYKDPEPERPEPKKKNHDIER